MGMEKKVSNGGNYVGSLLQLFDWNAKSRKKLFLTNSELPEQSKQKKGSHGCSPMAQLQMLNEDEFVFGTSINASSDFSCASSVTDEDFYGPRAPGVVARLMGLNSLPESNISEPSSTPYIACQSLCVADYETKNLGYRQDTEVSVQIAMEPKHQETNQPIKKFQAEVLPPKSAKSIPITHHRLLSPVKSVNFIPSKNAAHIMEVAAKIIEPEPQVKKKKKFPPVGSSSLPLRVKDLREKAQSAQKQSNLSKGCQRSGEFYSIKNLRGNSMNRNWKRSVDATSTGVLQCSGESSVGVKNSGKSISLALQAKTNVQKKEGLALTGSNLAIQKETGELSPNQLFKSQSTKHKSMLKKPSISNGSSVLRQSNQKQNCIADKGKSSLTSKARGPREPSRDLSSARQSNSCQLSGTSKVSSRKLGSEIKDDKRGISSSVPGSVAHKKRSVDGNYLCGKNQDACSNRIDKNGKFVQCSAIVKRQSSWNQDGGKTAADVISFTFNAPMSRLGALSANSSEKRGNCEIISRNFQSRRTQLNSDGIIASTVSILGHNVKGGDSLSTVLEQQLKELTHKLEFSPHTSDSLVHDAAPDLDTLLSSKVTEQNDIKDGMHTDNLGVLKEIGKCSGDISQERKLLDCRLLNTADSNSTEGSKQCSSILVQEVLGMYTLKMLGSGEGDTELSDSASSTSFETIAKRQETTVVLVDSEKPRMWEVEYVKEMLCNIEHMFRDYALGHACEIIDPRLFDQLESWAECLHGRGLVSKLDRLVLFNSVSQCLDQRCRLYVGGGCKMWAKGVSATRRKERLAKEVYEEISSWDAIGDSDVDELVDMDMSRQQGRWLDFEIEAFELGVQIESCILESLVDEAIAGIFII
ncbi:hypothetical protein F511_38634 [Dorcoceras hygrometricum]|uniref:DUF4378 domain-containing protein n=1 Tax=Dorcoceras hygrometricum TaxID=472368 RepID=A0A2Z7BHA7_9LAMI|nr:hypothetical protein F511_38634 [Dorcoceras hygrometricum]